MTYDGNTNDGGTAPVDPNSPYTVNSTVTVLGSGSLTKTGYTFAHWNTAADGSGTSYNPAATFTITADTTLFAQWTLNTYQLSVVAETGGTITEPASSPVTVNHGEATTITALADAGYTFSGWMVTTGTASIANDTSASTTITLTSGDATVTANFTINTYTLNYMANAGGTIVGTTPQTVNYGANGTLVTATPEHRLPLCLSGATVI